MELERVSGANLHLTTMFQDINLYVRSSRDYVNTFDFWPMLKLTTPVLVVLDFRVIYYVWDVAIKQGLAKLNTVILYIYAVALFLWKKTEIV